MRGSSKVSLSNGLMRSLSYTWFRLQRLKKSSCESPWHKCWGLSRVFHELFRFPSAFTTSRLRSKASTVNGIHIRFRAGIHLRTTRRVARPRRIEQPGFSPVARHTFRYMLRPCFRPETRMGFHTDHRATGDKVFRLGTLKPGCRLRLRRV